MKTYQQIYPEDCNPVILKGKFMCKNCNLPFKAERKRINCYDCVKESGLKQDKSEIITRMEALDLSCMDRRTFKKTYSFLYKRCCQYGLLDTYFETQKNADDKVRIEEILKQFELDEDKVSFLRRNPKQYQFLSSRNSLEKIRSHPKFLEAIKIHECEKKKKYLKTITKNAKNCKNRFEFQTKHNSQYKYTIKNNLLDTLFPVRLDNNAFSLDKFVAACTRKTQFGTFYVIQCHCDHTKETFYKFGITSDTPEIRHRTLEDFYTYKVIIEIQTDPKFVYNLEKFFKKTVHKYRPEVVINGLKTECFLDLNQILNYLDDNENPIMVKHNLK